MLKIFNAKIFRDIHYKSQITEFTGPEWSTLRGHWSLSSNYSIGVPILNLFARQLGPIQTSSKKAIRGSIRWFEFDYRANYKCLILNRS